MVFTERYCRTETENFYMIYDELDVQIVEEAKEKIEEMYRKVRKDFSLPSKTEKYEFFLCPDVDSYIAYTNKTRETYQDWMVGWTDYREKRLCILSPRAATDRSSEDMMKVILHEVVHIAMDSVGNPEEVELWISEGIALLYAEQINLAYIGGDDFPKVDSLEGEDAFVENGGYDYAGVYVWYFMKKFGADALKKVYMGAEKAEKYLYPQFEEEAVKAILKYRQ